jgi:diphthine synthase
MNGCEKMLKGRLVFVGLGLYDESDVSLKGLQEIKQCDEVFAEFYTTKLRKEIKLLTLPRRIMLCFSPVEIQ